MKALVAVLLTLAMVASAQASLVTLTDSSQIDMSNLTIGIHGPVGGYSVNFASGNSSLYFQGLIMRPGSYGVDGVQMPDDYGPVAWSWRQTATPPVGGPEGDKLQYMCSEFFWGGHMTLNVVAGQQYRLQIIGADPVGNPNPGPYTLTIDGVADTLAPTAGTDWLYTKTFTASSTTLPVVMSDYGTWGAMILNPIPEPATMSVLALGALGLLRRRNA